MIEVNDKEFVADISREICNYWRGEEFDDKLGFPGAQPVSVELKDLKTIKNEEYLCCPKLDGERYFLVCRRNMIFLVNRNMDFFSIRCNVNPYILKKGFILDGELVGKKFVVHDAIDILGQNVKTKDFDKRWKFACGIIGMFYRGGDIEVIAKTFWNTKDIKNMIKTTKYNNIPTDGIIFYPVKEPVGYKTQMNFFKWKPPGHHTVDFLVSPRDETTMELITWSKSKETTFTTLPVSAFASLPEFRMERHVVEFNTKIIGDRPKFEPIKVRSDKPRGNNLYTIRKTILNAKENITLESLIEYFS